MTYTVFIDGEEGTTGLQIRQRLEGRDELNLIHLDDVHRKDLAARKDALNSADLSILCLPDGAARDVAEMIANSDTRLIDASTAHRVNSEWVYGFPEMSPGQSDAIRVANRVTNPGCYPTGAIALILPLVSAGIVPVDHPIHINAVSGYSGGGKSLIAQMEGANSNIALDSAYFAYGLDLEHKHVPEMLRYSGLNNRPIFVPSVGRFRQGMVVQIPLQLWSLPRQPTVREIQDALTDYYGGYHFVSVANDGDTTERLNLLDPEELNGTNQLRLFVFGNDDGHQVVLAAQLDNLGKGAAGQTVQNLNLMLGFAESEGLE